MAKIKLVGGAELKRRILETIGEAYVSIVDDQFNSEGDAWGKPWQKISTKRRRGKRITASILTDTGDLRRNTSFRIVGDKVIVTNNKEYAAIHNFGGEIKIPKRKQTIRLKKGRFVSQFTKTGAKRKGVKARQVTIPATKFNMPQREFFVVNKKVLQSLKKEMEFVVRRMTGR